MQRQKKNAIFFEIRRLDLLAHLFGTLDVVCGLMIFVETAKKQCILNPKYIFGILHSISIAFGCLILSCVNVNVYCTHTTVTFDLFQ